jgi:hypothetical protein
MTKNQRPECHLDWQQGEQITIARKGKHLSKSSHSAGLTNDFLHQVRPAAGRFVSVEPATLILQAIIYVFHNFVLECD